LPPATPKSSGPFVTASVAAESDECSCSANHLSVATEATVVQLDRFHRRAIADGTGPILKFHTGTATNRIGSILRILREFEK
jgi:hypothetical protein